VSGVDRVNGLSSEDAQAELLRCCAVERWAQRVVDGRPYDSVDEWRQAADEAWRELDEEDWQWAINHHPRIGDRPDGDRFRATRDWSAEEQAGLAKAGDETHDRLAVGQQAYEEKFGYIFLICATGKSGDEMAAALEARLGNNPETELAVAAEELRKIMILRLEKLLVDERDYDPRT
jgi:2-oxo-4-hydroxy-4-carboxy-5-ureidoimidazoline decarboxylase